MLKSFLKNKPLFYDEIDYSRMPRVYATIKDRLSLPKIIHIVGTNGKGTTGRFLATALYSLGFKTGHYTSPHIFTLNERVWINGENIDDELLDLHHNQLLALLSKEDANSLSYFEYTTFLALYIYRDMDYVILEAGLGGEFDATAVFENILTLVTPIDIDHEAFLGSDIKSIARTKMNAIKTSAILGVQKYVEVEEVADAVADEKNLEILDYRRELDKSDFDKIELIAQANRLAEYLKENLSLAISALNVLKIEYEVDSFNNSKLYGRLTRLNENIVLDVGHNALAATSIYNSLKESKYTLVYNSFKDKDYYKILTILKPIVTDVEIIEVADERAESMEAIVATLEKLDIKYKKFSTVNPDKKYLVFGSFSVAKAFLKVYHE